MPADGYQISELVGRTLVRGTRTVRAPGRIRISGEWYYGIKLVVCIGRKVDFFVCDNMALEYHVRDHDTGKSLDTVKWSTREVR